MPTQVILVNDESFFFPLTHSRDQGSAWQKELANINGAIRTRQHNMGGGSSNADINNLARLTSLASKGQNTLSSVGVVVSYNDDKTPAQKIRDDMTNAFLSDATDMHPVIEALKAALGPNSNLSPEDQAKLLEMVDNLIELKGSSPENMAEAAQILAENLLDLLDSQAVPQAVVDFVHKMLTDIQAAHDIPALDALIAKIEGRMNPENYLQNAMGELLLQLNVMLDGDDLSAEEKAAIEAMIEQIEAAQKAGEPLPEALMAQLESVGFLSNGARAAFATLQDAMVAMAAKQAGFGVAFDRNFAAMDNVVSFANDSSASGLKTAGLAMVGGLAAGLSAFGSGGSRGSSGGASALSAGRDSQSQSQSRATTPQPSESWSKAAANNNAKPTELKPTQPDSNPNKNPINPGPTTGPINITPSDNPTPPDIGGGGDPLPPDPGPGPTPAPPIGGPSPVKPQPDQPIEGPRKKICTCDAFKKAAKPDRSIREIKEKMREEVGPGISETELNDKIITHLHELEPHQRKQLIRDIADEDFGGDFDKAKKHVEGLEKNQELNRQEAAKKEAEEKARNEARRKQREDDQEAKGKGPKDQLNPEGCPTHGDKCPEGSHDPNKGGKTVETSESKTAPKRRRRERKNSM